MALRRQMEIFARPTLPQPLLTIARQSGDTPPPPLAPGATLSAQVQGTAADGTLTLTINDRVLKVVSDLHLVQGTRITVTVEQREGQLVLRLLTPPGETPGTPQQALRQILPRQQPLQPLFTQLTRLASSGGTLATTLPAAASEQTALPTLPAGVREAIGNLLTLLPNNEKLATPEGLKQALHNSGMFFESRLLQGEGGTAVQGDLKTLLFRIAFLVRQTLKGLP
ncbi:MAG: hypothetical protein OQL08_12945, partial [Gammaproteobacteria bacterium]|nr:hypothetical protein [Gammaproteobacteria bacterium]